MTIVRRSSLRSGLAVACLALLSMGCDRSFDVTWTVEGQPAAEGCEGRGDRVALVVDSRDKPGEPARRSEVEAGCEAGAATISAGRDAVLQVELLRGDVVVGSATPVRIDNGTESPLAVDLELHTGELAATLTVLGESCEAAGASRFSVTLRADTGNLESRVIDEKEVACEAGVAVYRHPAVKIGSRYFVDAETTIGETRYEVAGVGDAVRIDKARTQTTVDLKGIGGQPGRDAGPVGYTDGGEGEGEGEDAGAVDAGEGEPDAGDSSGDDAGDTSSDDAGDTSSDDAGASDDDAGTSEADAGASDDDAGTSEADAGVSGDDAGASSDDAGQQDSGVCTPSCDGLQCGTDGCGGTCGTCGALDICVAGQCVLG